MQGDFYENYFAYVGESEAPNIFHRWTAASIVGAYLGRQISFPFGHKEIYPNQYIMLMGSPGTRKSTAIGIGQSLLAKAGYSRFAADRVSKEKFILEMKQMDEPDTLEDLEMLSIDEPSESYVVADEFGDFIGVGNMEFVTMLTKLWDNPPDYKQPKIHGQSAVVYKPTVNILSGNTPQNFMLTIPPEAVGTGFMSRLLLVHGESNGKKITFPKPPSIEQVKTLISHLQEMKATVAGIVEMEPFVVTLLDRIYKEYVPMDDPRFASYATRRFTHLLKLSTIHAAMRLSTVISRQDVLRANTLLHYTELRMPKALGEYGKAKNSGLSHSVMDILRNANRPVTMNQLVKMLSQDINKQSELIEVVKNLKDADKLQIINANGKQGFMPKNVYMTQWAEDLLLDDWLTPEEML